ncbi:MAG: ABC transporter permease [Spirochaetes bacterium]|nr:ABC transporter permease [Spirochaetota bacterium]
MDFIADGIRKAYALAISFDRDVYEVVFVTLWVTFASTVVSAIIGIIFATIVSLNEFPGKTFVVSLVNTGMGLPPVLVGLFTTLLLWRGGVFGEFNILYTPLAIIIAQVFIATPMVCGISLSALQQVPKNFRLQIRALGASRIQMIITLYRQARIPLLAAIMAGYGSVISEVGAALMVGGNIKGSTRVLTTAIVMESSRGNFERAIAFGIILLVLSFAVNLILSRLQQKGH